ncbi:hypothetical protein ONZ45_g4881 [Pleurotus djamor]|nr:hypothetical protein ONZ45_g4881 [Pleurotus djamor]
MPGYHYPESLASAATSTFETPATHPLIEFDPLLSPRRNRVSEWLDTDLESSCGYSPAPRSPSTSTDATNVPSNPWSRQRYNAYPDTPAQESPSLLLQFDDDEDIFLRAMAEDLENPLTPRDHYQEPPTGHSSGRVDEFEPFRRQIESKLMEVAKKTGINKKMAAETLSATLAKTGQCLQIGLVHAASAAGTAGVKGFELAKNVSPKTAMVTAGGMAAGVALAPVAGPAVLGAVGFTSAGIVSGSLAATLQASMGSIAAGSLFAGAQSVAMGGAMPVVGSAISGTVVAGTAAAVKKLFFRE